MCLPLTIEQLKKFGITTVQDDLSNPVNDANPAALGLGAMTEGVPARSLLIVSKCCFASIPVGAIITDCIPDFD